MEVYPRPRGGTRSSPASTRSREGLSPPTRGNQVYHVVALRLVRSIPAHAGEPLGVSATAFSCRVYPRPRGGTHLTLAFPSRRRGLSPPTRGNLRRCVLARGAIRSIPAHAGEPKSGRPAATPSRVYPRPRGGTSTPHRFGVKHGGLSPPTRGNRQDVRATRLSGGSIPAHAGEPGIGSTGAP